MNHDESTADRDMGDTAEIERLRWQLRGLRTEVAPGRDLWPDIQARLGRPAAVPPRRRPPAGARWGLAAAAVLALTLGLVLTNGSPDAPPKPVGARLAGTDAPRSPPLLREAEQLTRQYEAALLELPTPAPPLGHAVAELDASAAQIRQALQRHPESRLLLSQLQRTYARRLALAQRQLHS